MEPLAIDADPKASTARGSLATLALGAIGVVYGDIGTSPLYTLKTALEWAGGSATPPVALGMLSLIVWTLLITTSIKYVAVVMRADNEGEGGILALMSLLGIKHGTRLGIVAIGVLGAALLYGDGAITPAISVLSALEGLKLPVPAIAPYIVPLAVIVLVGVFGLQPLGSARIGKLFGPIMAIWFITIGLLGLGGLLQHPGTLMALDPRYGLTYLFTHGFSGFLVLGAVFLCATGAEALYADMGHFGPRPIRAAWYRLVLPMLLLNYAGQTAIVIKGTVAAEANPFFALCPAPLQVPLVLLATVATSYHQWRIFDDPPGDPARLVSAHAHHPDLGRGLRTNLCWLCQLALDDAHARADDHISLVGQFGGSLRYRRVANHAFDLAADVPGNARHLALEPGIKPDSGGIVSRRGPVLCRRQYDETIRRRLGPRRGGRDSFLSYVDLAHRSRGHAEEDGAGPNSSRIVHRANARQVQGSGYGNLPDERV